MESILFKLGIVKLSNFLFQRCYFFYKHLYFLYKKFRDRESIRFFRKIIKPGMTILDIGGNIGFYTILFSNLVGDNGTVHVFEPDSTNFKYLKRNTRKFKNVHLNNCAVGEKRGTTKLYYSSELNTWHQTYDSGENREFAEVNAIIIDDYFNNDEKVDFIKIDVEGFEYYVLKGLKKTIERMDEIKMISEFLPYGLKKSGIDPSDYLKLLENMGFEINFLDRENRGDFKTKINDRFFFTSIYCIKSYKAK